MRLENRFRYTRSSYGEAQDHSENERSDESRRKCAQTDENAAYQLARDKHFPKRSSNRRRIGEKNRTRPPAVDFPENQKDENRGDPYQVRMIIDRPPGFGTKPELIDEFPVRCAVHMSDSSIPYTRKSKPHGIWSDGDPRSDSRSCVLTCANRGSALTSPSHRGRGKSTVISSLTRPGRACMTTTRSER